jgi:hypothetical protein
MSEVRARSKFSCPACGGEARWDPARQALVCPYCSTVSPATLPEGGEIQEHDLATALRNIDGEQRGWAAEKRSVRCQSCDAVTVFDPSRVAQRCDFCGSSALIPYEDIKAPIRPESLLEFKIAESAARDAVRAWYGTRFWAPGRLKSRALTDTVHGVYLPYWTFDARVGADWRAEAGYYYWETESYTDSQGKRQTRQVRRTRWEPAAGSLEHFFDDELVPASKGVQPDLLRRIEPFPTKDNLKPYDPGYLSGWPVEQYQIDLIAAAQAARDRMEAAVTQMCAQAVPGDTQRNLQVSADFSAQTFKHILVPVWILSYTYGRSSYQAVINGYTGSIAGKYPLSWIKITVAVLLGLIAALIFLYLFSQS